MLVMDGFWVLFWKRICVFEEGKVIVKEGGGIFWVKFEGVVVEVKDLFKEEVEVNVW